MGSARYDQVTGDWIGGGIQPDLYCESRRGIPSDIGADFCVGTALDALEEADVQEAYNLALTGEQYPLKRAGGSLDGSGSRRPIYASIAKVSVRVTRFVMGGCVYFLCVFLTNTLSFHSAFVG